ncbi:phosphomannomutase [Candidatus Nitrosotenuis chungbukensis]|uniref:phosphomannomutase n=1 Tax=Candidatus Nitrosotenuis chungbukensis TaxID=1353246 RepID=UPI0005B27BD5|nr:phosphomannomutase [Candidatus Nitrosotenuis chungbukensis]WKT58086.1 phosphomannomutase [Candidatus Nitrosotenuis chungbukensis]
MKKSISGIRGIFGDDLTLKDILKFCGNFAPLIKSKKCAVGNDTRPSGDMVRETAIAALMGRGIDVYNLGMVPTPVVFREARRYGAGLVITSSHNPLEWNGLKFVIDGRGPNEKEFEKILQEKKHSSGKIGTEHKISSKYVQEASRIIGKARKVKVTVDVGGGAALDVAPSLLRKIGCIVQVINPKRGPDPTADPLTQLVGISKKADIGFAFDLDGDRLVVVKDGKKQSPDTTLALGVSKALDLGYKRFCLSIDTSIAVERYITDNGGVVVRSKVGEANVIDTMLKKKCQAGGEGSSGGFILPEFNMCRDGILTSGLIAAMDGNKVDQIIQFVDRYSQLRTKIAIESKIHDKVLEKFQKNVKGKFGKIITIDGVKVIVDEDTWALVRKSNTEDIIRISVESNDLQKAKRIQKDITALVKQSHDQVR